MKIVYISNEYPPDTGFGGIATYTRAAAAAMTSLGHEVHVVCRSESGEPNTLLQDGATIHRIGPGTFPLPGGRAWYPLRKLCRACAPHFLVRMAWAKEAATTIGRIGMQYHGFDIVEFPECGAEGFYVAQQCKCKTVVRLHTPWDMVAKLNTMREPLADRLLLSHAESSTARSAHLVTSPTHDLALVIQKKWRIPSVEVFSNPISTAGYKLSEGKDWIYTGRVERRKGVHILLAAYSNLCKSVDPPLLRIVGRAFGPWDRHTDYGDYIEKLIKKFGLFEKVEWIRGTSHESVTDLLARSSVAIFPSLWENLSYSCLEAMASGCAVVASACGGFSEIIKQADNGILFPPGDSEELTRALYRLHKHEDARKKVGIAGRVWVAKHCDTSVVGPRMEAAYRSLIKESHNG
jgi:glycosyltransferase involved in cell wall biosynthesis